MKKIIREARDTDVEQIRDLFVEVYGKDYPFADFYNTEWLKKLVYDDHTLFLVMELDGKIAITCSMNMSVGSMDDMIGEAGRFVASTSEKVRGKGLAFELAAKREELAKDRVQFLFSEARTIHPGSQRNLEKLNWVAAGFEPMKYLLDYRESAVFYIKAQGMASELRRNNPHVIPEIATLAQTVLKNMNFPVDVIIEDEIESYPMGQSFDVERLQQKGMSSLLRIERGRVSNREIFGGNYSLTHGLFQIQSSNSHYLVAKDGDAVLGAAGFTYDPIDHKIRIFELIEFDDLVKGFLLASVDRIAREEFNAVYQEVDVSAYSPKIQRTFERLGFIPVAYCPSMVFSNVERLDIIRMAKISCKYEIGPTRILDAGKRMQEIVERGLEDRLVGIEITDQIRKTDLFRNLPDGDLFHLARISSVSDYDAGTTIVSQGSEADAIYILESGAAEARDKGQVVGKLNKGNICGEMALVEPIKRSADVVLTKDCRIIKIPIPRLNRLMETRPNLGYILVHNLARGLSTKVREHF
ncbi:cyclic nucleotide-binding domain-containing protein [Bacteroidota bacterium]